MKHLYSLALALLFVAGASQAQQIPNGSFEVWEGGNPTGWITTNFPPVVYPITQSSTAVDGQSSLHGEVLDLGGFGVPAMAATGRMLTTETFELGFPFTSRPDALNGFVSAELNGTDTLNLIAVFRSGGDSIGVAFHRVGADQANLTSFSAPVYWLDGRTPDTAYVMIIIDGEPAPTAGSSFNVDGLTFGPAASVQGPKEAESLIALRTSEGYEFQITNSQPQSTLLEIVDIHGRTVEVIHNDVTSSTRIRWTASHLSNGMYIARLSTPGSSTQKKIILKH